MYRISYKNRYHLTKINSQYTRYYVQTLSKKADVQ